MVDFEQRLLALDEDIQAFKKKEVMNMDEMRNNVGNLKQITDRLDAALMELEVRVAAPSHTVGIKSLCFTLCWCSDLKSLNIIILLHTFLIHVENTNSTLFVLEK